MKVLVADDDAVNRQIVCSLLRKWSYEAVVAKDGSEAWRILEQPDPPELVILDWMMPGMDGVDVCRVLRKTNRAKYTYVILLTTKYQKQEILQGLEAGADDYITKPFDSGELRARLRTGQRILGLQAELLDAHNQLEYEASHDHLTGLWNRGALMKLLQAELSRACREGVPVAVLAADLDYFKRINDTYGHPVGDTVLQEVARRMTASVRLYDVIGRMGGEEFLLILPKCDLGSMALQAERIRAAIARAPVETTQGKLSITMSLGATSWLGALPANVDSLLHVADRALYQSKRNGRNRVTVLQENAASVPKAEVPVTRLADSDATRCQPR